MPGIPMTSAGIAAVRSFEISSQPLPTPTKTYYVSGVTRDTDGVTPLASCNVTLLRTADKSVAAQGIVSDDVGAYAIAASPAVQHQVIATDPTGTKAGATIDTLVGS